jgi:hypothetical protein
MAKRNNPEKRAYEDNDESVGEHRYNSVDMIFSGWSPVSRQMFKAR